MSKLDDLYDKLNIVTIREKPMTAEEVRGNLTPNIKLLILDTLVESLKESESLSEALDVFRGKVKEL